MQQALQLKPYQTDNNKKVKVIQLTDLTFHTSQKRPTTSPSKKIEKSFEQNAPGRLYESLKVTDKNINGVSTMEIRSDILEYIMSDPNMLEYVKKEEANGYKVVIELPKNGLPTLIGKDTQEFIESKKGKRILRRLDKK